MRYISYIFLSFFMFFGCTPKPTAKLKPISYGKYHEVEFSSIPSWEGEDFDRAFAVFEKTCKRTADQELFKSVCEKSKETEDPKRFFEENFTPFISLSQDSLATGYFEPTLEGSLVQNSDYPYPVYGKPADLVKVEIIPSYKKYISRPLRGRFVNGKIEPYYSREEINNNVLQEEPLCYVKDKVDLFFLQVQGSGRVVFDDNTTLCLGYADQNGHPYVSIGKEMIKKGLIKKEEVSLESIQAYLSENPAQADEILELNPSYVFFEKRPQAASGALGVVLEEGRSIAVDRKNIPLGMPVFISTKEPLSGEKYERIVFAHDTGGAIKGEGRIDIFFGSTPKAREQAGKMQDRVSMWILMPNDYLSQSNEKVNSYL